MNRLILPAVVLSIASTAFAADYRCQITSYSATTGFQDSEAAKSWVPDQIAVSHNDAGLAYSFFDEVGHDPKPKTDGSIIKGKDEIGINNGASGGGSMLVKTRFEIDTSTNTAKFRGDLSKGGYKAGKFGGNYQCQ